MQLSKSFPVIINLDEFNYLDINSKKFTSIRYSELNRES